MASQRRYLEAMHSAGFVAASAVSRNAGIAKCQGELEAPARRRGRGPPSPDRGPEFVESEHCDLVAHGAGAGKRRHCPTHLRALKPC